MTSAKENPLYCIERILGRFAAAPVGVKNEIIFFLQQKAWTTHERERGINYIVDKLFPEMRPVSPCLNGCVCKKLYKDGCTEDRTCKRCGCVKQNDFYNIHKMGKRKYADPPEPCGAICHLPFGAKCTRKCCGGCRTYPK